LSQPPFVRLAGCCLTKRSLERITPREGGGGLKLGERKRTYTERKKENLRLEKEEDLRSEKKKENLMRERGEGGLERKESKEGEH